MVDGYRSKLVNVLSGMPQGSVLGPLLFLLYTLELFYILENKLIGYADDSNLMAVMPSPCVRVTVAEPLIRDLDRVGELYDRAVSGAWFLTGGVIECDIAHRRSVAVLGMLYKITSNPMHPPNDVLPGL